MEQWSEIDRFTFSRAAQKHDKIDGHVGDVSLLADDPFVGKYDGRMDVIVGGGEQVVQGTVNGIVFSRFHLNRQYACAGIVINEEVHLAFIAVVVIKQFVPRLHFSITFQAANIHFSILKLT